MVSSRWTRIGIAALVVALLASWAFYASRRTVTESPTDAQWRAQKSRNDQWQAQQSLNSQLKLDPVFRREYAVHLRFMDLSARMPAFDRASFGPTVSVLYWRSVKWGISEMYERRDGRQYVDLTYGPGPGVDYRYTAELVNGHYVGRVNIDWESLSRNPQAQIGFAPDNTLPITCRDVRGSSSQFAAIPARPAGPTVSKQALNSASMRVSTLPGTVLACYRFAGMNLIELAFHVDSVLFRLDGQRLTPVVRGYIGFADPAGRFIVVSAFAGYDANDLPLNDYLEAFALSK